MKDVKQKLFSKFSRHDKTEAPLGWPDDIDQIEQVAEEMKRVSADLVKRMSACHLSGGCASVNSGSNQPPAFTGGVPGINNTVTMTAAEKEKRLRKLPESALAQTMMESGEKFASLNPNLRGVFTLCGDALNRLSEERLTWENLSEAQVLECFRQCSEEEVPMVMRLRKQLWKLNGELRAARERLRLVESGSSPGQNNSSYQQTHSSTDALTSSLNATGSVSHHYPNDDIALSSSFNQGANSGSDSSKLQQARIFKEDLETEVNHLKDQCLKEMYRFDGALVSYTHALMEYLALEAEYHRNSLQILDSVIPTIRKEYLGHYYIPVFGRELQEHLLATGRQISYVFHVCIEHLDTPANLEEEGLFRIAGSKSKVDTLTSAMNVMRAEKIMDQYDAFVIADSLKQYLRSLPEPLLTFNLFEKWIAAIAHNSSTQDQLTALWHCCSALPPANWLNLAHLIRYLFRLAQHSNKNKMTASNLGIIFGQNLLSHPSQDVSASPSERLRLHAPHNNNNNNIASRVTRTCQSRDGSPPIASVSQMGHQKKGSMGSYSLESFATGGFPIANSPSTATNPNNDELSAKLMSSNSQGVIVELLITHCPVFFPEGVTEQRLVPQPQFSPGGRSRILTQQDDYHHHHNQSSRSLRAQYLSGNKEQEIRPVRAPGVETSASCHDREELMDGRPRRSSIHDSCGYTPSSSHEPSPVTNTPSSVDPKHFPSTFYRRRTSDGAAARSKSAVRTAHLRDIQFDDSTHDSDQTQPNSSGKSSIQKPYPAKSFHADVYDTLFALQSLNSQNGGSDYLSRVRSVYEGRTLTKPGAGPHNTTPSREARESSGLPTPHVAPKDWTPGGNTKARMAKLNSDSSSGNRLLSRRDMFSSYSEDRMENRTSDLELLRQMSNMSDKTRHLPGGDGTQSLKKSSQSVGSESRRAGRDERLLSTTADSHGHSTNTKSSSYKSNNSGDTGSNSVNQSMPALSHNSHSSSSSQSNAPQPHSSTSTRQSGSSDQELANPHNAAGFQSHSESNGLFSLSVYQQCQQARSATLPSRSKLEAPLSCLSGPVVLTSELSVDTDDVTTPTSSPPISSQLNNFSPKKMSNNQFSSRRS